MEGVKEGHSTTIMDELFVDFKCSICLEVFIDATMTSCRHLYCQFCINKWLQFSPKCPQCLNTINKCTPIQNIDDQIDGIFRSLPQSIREDREEVKQRRRKLEKDATGSVQPFNTTIDKLRAERTNNKINLTASEEKWLEKLSPYIKQAYPSLSSSSTSCLSEEIRIEKDKLPRLVSTDLQKDYEKNENPTSSSNINNNNNNSSGHSKYENLKLPPIKLKGSRQVRGITTSTSPQQQTTEDFPKGMEGDIQPDAGAEDSIRELERRNRYLEDQLFGAYDRIIDNIKENNDTLAKSIPLNVFSNNTNKNGTVRKLSNPLTNNNNSSNTTIKKSVIKQSNEQQPTNNDNDDDDLACDQDPANSIHDLDDLLQETEELMEIENFLKEFPFERIRDDEDLIGYNDSDVENDEIINLDLMDSNHIENISAHGSVKLKSKRKLTKDQEIIENFYKKLESKRPIHVTATNNNNNNPISIVPSKKTGREKIISQQGLSSKSKRTPLLNKLPINSTITTSNNNNSSSSISNTASRKIVSNSHLNPSLGHSPSIISNKKISNTSTTSSDKKTSNNAAIQKNTPTLKNMKHNNNNNIVSPLFPKLSTSIKSQEPKKLQSETEEINIQSTINTAVGSSDVQPTMADCTHNGETNEDSALGLNYEDFKLEVDFLDGDGDWRKFNKVNTPKDNNNTTTSTNLNTSSKKLLPLLQAKEAELKKNTSNIMFPSVKTVRKNQNATTQKKNKYMVTSSTKTIEEKKETTQQVVIKQNPSQKFNHLHP